LKNRINNEEINVNVEVKGTYFQALEKIFETLNE
jgi:hypothetical protein